MINQWQQRLFVFKVEWKKVLHYVNGFIKNSIKILDKESIFGVKHY